MPAFGCRRADGKAPKKGIKKTKDRDERELALMERCHAALERGESLEGIARSRDEEELMATHRFLGLKPRLVVINAAECEPLLHKDFEIMCAYPAEIVGGAGVDVLDGRAQVVTRSGVDVTALYVAGAREATGGRGVDVVLDSIGAPYLKRNLAALATGPAGAEHLDPRFVNLTTDQGLSDNTVEAIVEERDATDEQRRVVAGIDAERRRQRALLDEGVLGFGNKQKGGALR